jgi:Ras GTPase-activating-like protein IQGAP2/3
MDPSSSNASPVPKSGSSSGPFAYQTRLLERTTSRGSGSSLQRNNSQSGIGILTNTTGVPGPSASPRKWVPSHRVANSLDAVRGRWEERAKEAAGEDNVEVSPKEGSRSRPPMTGSTDPTNGSANLRILSDFRPTTPPTKILRDTELQGTPTYLKRRTMPAPIFASPLSPNTTGVTIESDSAVSTPSPTSRIYLPLRSSKSSHSPSSHGTLGNLADAPPPAEAPPSNRYRRSNTLDSANWTGSSSDRLDDRIRSQFKVASRPYADVPVPHVSSSMQHRPTFLYSSGSDTDDRRLSRDSSSLTDGTIDFSRSPVLLPSTSVMSPTPYRSSYMSNKKSSMYGDNISAGRKLGRHLPRIASGDGDDKLEAGTREDESLDHRDGHERRTRDWNVHAPLSPEKILKQDFVGGVVPNADDVAGLPGRLQLKAPSVPSSPSPSSRLLGGLWADTQRHLIHAYEYLCHVGEAQQWIEGCLGEELGFGVVEMEDGLRNGVVLAKLVRVFQGEGAVKRIYEVSVVAIVVKVLIHMFYRPQSWTFVTRITSTIFSILFVKLVFLK